MDTSLLRKTDSSDALQETALENQKYIRSQSVVSRVMAGETLIVPVRGKVGDLASIYSFNQTGSLIWKLLEAPKGLTELVTAIEQEYVVGRERAHQDATQFLSEMLLAGLVEVSDGFAAEAERPVGREELTAAGAR